MANRDIIVFPLDSESEEEKIVIDRIDSICKSASSLLIQVGFVEDAQKLREVIDLVYEQRALLLNRVEHQFPCVTETVRGDTEMLGKLKRKYHLGIDD